jgi:hypothetical protein
MSARVARIEGAHMAIRRQTALSRLLAREPRR